MKWKPGKRPALFSLLRVLITSLTVAVLPVPGKPLIINIDW